QSFHHFVAIHRPLLQQVEEGKFHITSPKETRSLTAWAKRPTSTVHTEETRPYATRTKRSAMHAKETGSPTLRTKGASVTKGTMPMTMPRAKVGSLPFSLLM